MYYDYNKLYSYNALFNFIIGERGVGKTYGIMKKAVKDFIKTMNDKVEYDESGNKISGPSQFVYLRCELIENAPQAFLLIKKL